MRAVSLLTTVARLHPQVWDAIIPHGPPIRTRADLVALNPQPLPPVGPDAFLIGAAAMAHELVRIAVEREVGGEPAAGLLTELIDDWCGTPWPRRWPRPWPGPGPREDFGPQPDPWVIDTARVVGALVFADAGSRLGDGELGRALLEGADRLAEVAVGG